ncbi:HAUS augmin-like complex subunit 3 [Odontomachus brunneus]|uniref:HAUS augmin-like complex subunit 3 n=1 Tax=Odontomachus brunneus TaxID=486640 RepID=UPI0013F1BB9D|nr:HAUS augmin-like complex subunit 3 [Odontomachus brunneus]
MSVTGKMLCNKLCGLRPDLSSKITPEILSKICDDSSTQPFLEWFYKNVNSTNVLSSEEIKLKNILQDTNEWLEDEALDIALEEATRDCPDLLHLVDLDNTCKEDLFEEYKTLKDYYKEDKEYLNLLQQSIINLKKVENKLEDDIEEAEAILNKEQIKTQKLYEDCNVVLEEFDRDNCQFSKDVETLLNIYVDTARNQGDAVLWSQMPIDSFIKQIELYNHYLGIHIKKQFGSINNKEDQDEDSNYASLINNSKEKQVDERMHELNSCRINLTYSKTEEINADIQVESCIAILQCVKDIYNGGVLKVPENNKIHDEMLTLSMKRDILEQNVELLRDQLFSAITQFAEMETMKILKNDALGRFERRQTRLEKLKNLYRLAGEHGHVHVDLLYMLINVQHRNLHEVAEFIADARHYITTEYKLSSARCEVMQQQQDEYAIILMESPKTCNAFNQIFVSMVAGNCSDQSLSSALKKYDDLIADNAEKKLMLEIFLNDKIGKLQKLTNEVNKHYMAEVQNQPTNSLKPISYGISSSYEEISTDVLELQEDVIRIRNQFKERMRTDAKLEREKDILWQRFLADTDTLRMKYEEAKQRANNSHFGGTSES